MAVLPVALAFLKTGMAAGDHCGPCIGVRIGGAQQVSISYFIQCHIYLVEQFSSMSWTPCCGNSVIAI